MELTFNIDLAGWLVLIAVSAIFGAAAQLIGDARAGYEWVVDGIGFFVGAIVASEFVTAWQTVEPVWFGIAVIPALIGGLVVGVVVELATRALTGGSYTHGAVSA